MDIYTRAQNEDEDLLDVPLHGRYCGNDMDNLPNLLISMYNVFIIAFYTDNIKDETGFLGTYEFIDGSKYTFLSTAKRGR